MLNISIEEENRYAQLQVFALDFARLGKVDDLEKMINAGLNVNLCDHKGNTLLMLASYNNQEKILQLLISKNAKVDQKNDRGQTPLAGVCFKGYLNIVKILIKAGADKNVDNGLGLTPIKFASLFGNKEVFLYLQDNNKNKIFEYIMNLNHIIKSFFTK